MYKNLAVAVVWLLFGVLFFHTLGSRPAEGAITSITLTTPAPTVMSTTQGYYLASRQYTFTVNVQDPVAPNFAAFTQLQVTLPAGANITMSVVTPLAVGANAVNVAPASSGTATCNIFGTANNFTATIVLTMRWDAGATLAWNTYGIIASATSSNNLTDTKNVAYGISTTIRLLNPVMDGDGADGILGPWHAGANVTGTLVYNFPGAGLLDVIGAENTSAQLMLDGFATGAPDPTPAALSLAFPPGAGLAVGNHLFTVQATMTTGGALVTTSNTFPFVCNSVRVNDVALVFGGGVSLGVVGTQVYYRSRAVAGTQIQVTAQMSFGAAPLIGATTIRVRDTLDGINYDVVIPSGSTTAVLNMVPYPGSPAAGNTNTHTYQVIAVFGGATEAGQNVMLRTVQPGNGFGAFTVCWWENLHPPGAAALPFNGAPGLSASALQAVSVTLAWPNLFAATDPYRDFDTYRIYYKQSLSPTWIMVDRYTLPPATFGILGTITTNNFTITGLLPLTSYDFRLSAADVFGNEVALGNQPTLTVSTTPSQIDATVSDGMVTYGQNDFNANADPAAHPLRETAIKVSLFVVTAGTQPDAVNLVIADNNSDCAAQYGTCVTPCLLGPPADACDDLTSASYVEGTNKWSIPATKVAANTWEAYIPTTHPLLKMGTSIRFIVQTVTGAGVSYSDSTAEALPPGNWWSREWRIKIATPAIFAPWPVRILNNVMTPQIPCCYPTFYLVTDALVTIKVYDVKGRVVVTLLENAYRKGGQNIKENGWCGRNKSNRKVGPGLYFIHVLAKVGSTTLIDKHKKVVVRW